MNNWKNVSMETPLKSGGYLVIDKWGEVCYAYYWVDHYAHKDTTNWHKLEGLLYTADPERFEVEYWQELELPKYWVDRIEKEENYQGN